MTQPDRMQEVGDLRAVREDDDPAAGRQLRPDERRHRCQEFLVEEDIVDRPLLHRADDVVSKAASVGPNEGR